MTLRAQRVVADANHRGASPDKTTQFLELRRLEEVDHLDGLCGAPVFAVRSEGSFYRPVSFAGMVIQQTSIRGAPDIPWEVRYISSSIIYSALDKAENR
jgi:hypothetical protein